MNGQREAPGRCLVFLVIDPSSSFSSPPFHVSPPPPRYLFLNPPSLFPLLAIKPYRPARRSSSSSARSFTGTSAAWRSPACRDGSERRPPPGEPPGPRKPGVRRSCAWHGRRGHTSRRRFLLPRRRWKWQRTSLPRTLRRIGRPGRGPAMRRGRRRWQTMMECVPGRVGRGPSCRSSAWRRSRRSM